MLVRKSYPSEPPTAQADWTAINALMQMQFLYALDTINWLKGGSIRQGTVLHIRGTVYYADSDTVITGAPSDYVEITPSGATATAAYVVDLTGVGWSDEYNGYYDSSGTGDNLYLFDEGKAARAGVITDPKTVVGWLGSANVKTSEAQTISGVKTFSELIVLGDRSLTPYGFGKQVGSGLSISGAGTPALAALTSTEVAFIDDTLEELRVYRFNGSTWSQVGSGLSISGAGRPALAALNSTDVAFIDRALDSLRTYRWNGATWSQVGSGLSISPIGGSVKLAALNSTDVAFFDSDNDELRTYRFDGSTWSQVGSGSSISFSGAIALATLNSTDVAFFDNNNDELRTYRFNGATWSIVGSGLSISTTGNPALAALNATDVAFIDDALEELRTYRFDGSTWSQVGSGLSISGTGVPALAALTSTEVAFIDDTLEELRTYRAYGVFI